MTIIMFLNTVKFNFMYLKYLVFIFLVIQSAGSFAQNYPYVTQLSGASEGVFNFPRAMTSDELGNTYVFDYGLGRLQVLTLTGSVLKYVTHYPFKNFEAENGQGVPYMNKIAFLPPNKLVGLVGSLHKIYVFTIGGTNITPTAEFGSLGSTLGKFDYPNSVAVDSKGKIYVSDRGNNRIQVLTMNGSNLGYYASYGSRGNGDGQFNGQSSIAVDNQDRIYVADPSNSRIQVLTIDGMNIGFLRKYSGGNGSVKFSPIEDIEVDKSGKVYFRHFKDIQVLTINGNNFGLYSQYLSPATFTGEFADISIDQSTGSVLTNNSNNGIIQVISPSGTNLNLVSSIGRDYPNSSIIFPTNVFVSSANLVYVSDINTSSLNLLTLSGSNLEVQNSFVLKNSSLSGGVQPWGVGYDKMRNHTYVSDYTNNRLLTLSISGNDFTLLSTIGGIGSLPGKFSIPYGIATDSQGKVYVADGLNHRIQVFTVSGSSLGFYASFGSLGSISGYFNQPVGIAVDSVGKIYVTDLLNSRVQILTMSGTNIGYYTQFGTIGKGDGQFQFPTSIAIDGAGKLYVTDYYNGRVQVLTIDGINIGYFGQFGSPGNGNGEFNLPISITINRQGKIFVGDLGNSRIQVFEGATPYNGTIITRLEDFEKSIGIVNLFPNPSQEKFTITAKFEALNDIQIEVLDAVHEKPVYSYSDHGQSWYEKTIDLEGYSSGLYFVRISAGGSVKVVRWVKL